MMSDEYMLGNINKHSHNPSDFFLCQQFAPLSCMFVSQGKKVYHMYKIINISNHIKVIGKVITVSVCVINNRLYNEFNLCN